MLLSSISAYLILGLLSTVHAAPTTRPGTPTNDIDDSWHIVDGDEIPNHVRADWQNINSEEDFVMFDSTSSGHVEKVFGPFTKRVDVVDHAPDPKGPFTAEQAGVPTEVVETIETKFTGYIFPFSDSAPLRFSTQWPKEVTDPSSLKLRLGYWGRNQHKQAAKASKGHHIYPYKKAKNR
ncbi:hypothetical protein F5878DRAFT_177228 [Lentinula raphanica]|uniref:Uncharacterized protein n=1 Tax=Lentinula raphanica TaxID=153919 RepID=A0AA38P8F0_9AGAR|nr:hypothetical protein F5878DRAFT_177228 [Lentinula raphanica]